MLEVIKEGMKTLSGKFGDSVNHKYFFASSSFSPDLELKYHRNGKFCSANGFFTSGSTCLLKLVAKITIPGKLTSLAGSAEEEMKQNRLFDFQPLLLDPKHSDIVLKCGDARFLCHKVILALRYYLKGSGYMSGHVTKLNSRSVVFDRMLDQNMMEAQMGEVDILDADPDTLKRMLEFIYTGQVEVASF